MTGADIAKFREFVEVLSKANSPELMTQADMRCLLAIAASSHSARLANQELQVELNGHRWWRYFIAQTTFMPKLLRFTRHWPMRWQLTTRQNPCSLPHGSSTRLPITLLKKS